MTPFSFYRPDTGAVAAQWYTGTEPELNAPDGHVPIAGKLDARRHRVRLVTDDHGAQQPVVDVQPPPRPADTAEQTWTWDDTAQDWRSAPTLAKLQATARQPVLAQLAGLDARLARPIAEIAEAQALGEQLPAEAVERLRAVNAEKAALRARLTAIAAAPSTEALTALLFEDIPPTA